MKEAGVSTNSDKVVLRNGKPQEQTVATSAQTNKFKPANHGGQADNTQDEGERLVRADSAPEQESAEVDKSVGIMKTRSLDSPCTKTRSRGLKASVRDAIEGASNKQNGASADQLMADEELVANNGTNSSASLTAPTAQERVRKRRSEDSSNQKLSHPKNKDDQSADESSVKSAKAKPEIPKVPKISAKERMNQSLKWISEINDEEASSGKDLPGTHHSDDMPSFCSNKICPISEDKISKSAKVLNLAKKVTLRKVVLDESDDRWYCIKCLKAHNDSLYCYYCEQIYFISQDYEDDGKAWVMCDD